MFRSLRLRPQASKELVLKQRRYKSSGTFVPSRSLARSRSSNDSESQIVPGSSGHQWGLYALLAAGGALAVFVVADRLGVTTAEAEEQKDGKKRLVILGSGWGALSMLKDLDGSNYDVTVVSPRNYFLFTPLLPSTTVGSIDTRSLVEPIRKYFTRTKSNAKFYEATCTDIDVVNKKITCQDKTGVRAADASFEVPYDYLVVAVGAISNTFGTPGVEDNCFFLKNVEDALAIREKVMDCFESANLPSTSEEEKKRLLHFMVVGGGPTGVEFAAELNDFLFDDLHKWYPTLRDYVKITLVQSGDHILNAYDAALSSKAEQHFQRKNIELKMNSRITEVKPGKMTLLEKQTNTKNDLPFELCVWATGIGANPLVSALCQKIPEQTHSKLLITDYHLTVNGRDDIYAIGDCSTVSQKPAVAQLVELFEQADTDKNGFLNLREFKDFIVDASSKYPQLYAHGRAVDHMFAEADENKDDQLSKEEFKRLLVKVDSKLKALPATAQVASQQGQYLASLFNQFAKGSKPGPFKYKHKGSLAYVGGDNAVGEMGHWTMSGWATWLMYRSVYVGKQHSWRNKISVAWDLLKVKVFGRDISRF